MTKNGDLRLFTSPSLFDTGRGYDSDITEVAFFAEVKSTLPFQGNKVGGVGCVGGVAARARIGRDRSLFRIRPRVRSRAVPAGR